MLLPVVTGTTRCRLLGDLALALLVLGVVADDHYHAVTLDNLAFRTAALH